MGEKSFDRLLERCLQEMESTGDVDAVLRRHPEHAEELRSLLQLASSLREGYAEVPEPQAQLAVGRARLHREARDARGAAAAEQVAARREALEQERRSNVRLRLVPTLVSIAVVVAVGIAGTAGVALAADAAGPGDPFYSLDRTMERIQLRLTYNPEAASRLRMRLTEERMSELQQLVRKQDQERLQEALGEYGDAVGELAAGPGARKQLAEPARISEMNQVLARNEEQMRYAFQTGDDEQDDDGELEDDVREGDGWYTGTMTITHPVASSLANQYEISYTQVVSWFADGYGFGEIMHALKTSETLSGTHPMSDTTPSGILTLKTELGGWGQVWQEFGLIGRPDDVGPPHDAEDGDDVEAPENGEPKRNEKEPGPPDGVGPPDHAGPPDGDQDQLQDRDRDQDRDPDRDRDQDKDNKKDEDKQTGPPDEVPPDHADPPGGDGPPGQAGRDDDEANGEGGRPDDAGRGR